MKDKTPEITELILCAAKKARKEKANKPEKNLTSSVRWPIDCTVGPGLEGAIACETKVGYVNGSMGHLSYRGYDIFDLCAYSTYEEVCFLLIKGYLPSESKLKDFNKKLVKSRFLPQTQRMMGGVPIETMSPMSALRLGTLFMRRRLTWRDIDGASPGAETAIASDEDSIPMETEPMGERHAIYEFRKSRSLRPEGARNVTVDATSIEACIHLVSGLATITAGIERMRDAKMPVEPDPDLSHAANLLYMMTGERPTQEEERVMDVALILHADHGMNASTFAAMVVASTMSDIYFSIGSGIAALTGPLHGGANEQVLKVLQEIGSPENVDSWYDKMRRKKKIIPGFGHRVYKLYDPRARVLEPLAKYLIRKKGKKDPLYKTARALEKKVIPDLGKKKGIYPNVDFYSGLVYHCLGIPTEMYPPLFAVSRVAGWCARVHEYLGHNRIFRPRATYIGEVNRKYKPISRRKKKDSGRK